MEFEEFLVRKNQRDMFDLGFLGFLDIAAHFMQQCFSHTDFIQVVNPDARLIRQSERKNISLKSY